MSTCPSISRLAWAATLLLLLLCLFTSRGENPPLPDRRELWVPADRLKEILGKNPQAVLLSREEYETLVRDALAAPGKAPAPPRSAVLSAGKYHAQLAGKVAQVHAEFSVHLLTDDWVQVPLTFGAVPLSAVHLDGEAALLPTKGPSPPTLLLRGRGERIVAVDFTLPVTQETSRHRLQFKAPSAAAGIFTLDLPGAQRVESPRAIKVTTAAGGTRVEASVSPDAPLVDLAWREVSPGGDTLAPLVLANGIFLIDSEKVRVDFGFTVETQLGALPGSLQITLPPGAQVLQATGDELAAWKAVDGQVTIDFQKRERSALLFWITYELPSLAGVPENAVRLAVPTIAGFPRMQGLISLSAEAGVKLKEIAADPAVRPAGRSDDAAGEMVLAYEFLTPPGPFTVAVEQVHPRFSADLDTLVDFQPEAIFLERTVTLHFERGEIFQLSLTLPTGEEVIAVRSGLDANAGESEPDWRMDEANSACAGATPASAAAHRCSKCARGWSRRNGRSSARPVPILPSEMRTSMAWTK